MTTEIKKHAVEGIQKYFLLGTVIILICLFFTFLAPFLSTLFIAAVIVASIYPVHKFLSKKIKLSESISALITLTLVVSIVLVPLIYFSLTIISQATSAYFTISNHVNELAATNYDLLPILEKYPKVEAIVNKALEYNPISMKDIMATAGDVVKGTTKFLLEHITNIIKNLSLFVLHLLVFFFALFYFIRDGKKIVLYVRSLIPLRAKYRKELFKKILELMHSIVFGMFGAALAQGLMLGIGLAIAGVDNAVFWGAIGALFSPIPYIGAAVIWVPISISLLFSGKFVPATFLIAWCAIIVSSVDNFIKPFLIGAKSMLHPFAMMLVIFGGILTFGFKGIIFGPFVLMLTLAFLYIYKLEYEDVLEVVPDEDMLTEEMLEEKKAEKKIEKKKKK